MKSKEDRIKTLIDAKLFTGETLSSHFKTLIEKPEREQLKESLNLYQGDTWQEKVWRFINNDTCIHYCKSGCGNPVKFFETFKNGFRTYCSRQCVPRQNFTFDGKTHSSSTKSQMKENHADFKGDNNPFKNSLKDPNKLLAHKSRMQTIWDARDAEWREKFSEKLSARAPNESSFCSGRGHICGYHESNKIEKGKFWYRSSWELALAKKLDLCSEIIKYDVEQIRIKYNLDGKTRYTYCDFNIITECGTSAVIEVKPDTIALLKQQILYEQVSWCDKNNKQYAIIDDTIINQYFEKLIAAIKKGQLNARTYLGQRHITSAITSEIIRT